MTVEDRQLDFGYSIAIPDAAADPVLRGEPHGASFVGYLRRAFRWGGFPGCETCANRPEEALAALTQGLLPI